MEILGIQWTLKVGKGGNLKLANPSFNLERKKYQTIAIYAMADKKRSKIKTTLKECARKQLFMQ